MGISREVIAVRSQGSQFFCIKASRDQYLNMVSPRNIWRIGYFDTSRASLEVFPVRSHIAGYYFIFHTDDLTVITKTSPSLLPITCALLCPHRTSSLIRLHEDS